MELIEIYVQFPGQSLQLRFWIVFRLCTKDHRGKFSAFQVSQLRICDQGGFLCGSLNGV